MTAKIELGAWLNQAAHSFAGQSDHPMLEAQVMAAAVLGCARAWVVAHPEFILEDLQIVSLANLQARRLQGEPLPYLLKKWEFFGLEFTVSPAVLIPRPETELLVEQALDWLKSHPHRRLAADVGAGSGCIAISLAKNCATLTVFASDLSFSALRVARQNISRHQVENQVLLFQADLLETASLQLDLLCANLPYIPSATLAGLEVAAYEPQAALDGGPDGLQFITRLLDQSSIRMAPKGLILCEIETGQAQMAFNLALRFHPGAHPQVLPDLAGHPRVLRIDLP
jgi:release factor glutamine methyltransferase